MLLALFVVSVFVAGLVLVCMDHHYDLTILRTEIRSAKVDVKYLEERLKLHGEMVDKVVDVQQDTLRILGTNAYIPVREKRS